MRAQRTVGIALILVIICSLSPASSAGGAGVTIGFTAGVNIAKSPYKWPGGIFDVKELDNSYRTVFGGGGKVSFTFTDLDFLSIESGLLLNMKGGSTRLVAESPTSLQDPIEMTFEVDTKILYLTIPLHVRMSFKPGKITPYIKTGLGLDVLLAAKKYEKQTYDGSTSEGETDIKDDLTAFDLGLVAGAGVEIPSGGRALVFVEATYCHGLIDILDPENAGFDVEVKNRVIGIMAGVRF